MQIADERFRPDLEKLFKVPDLRLVIIECFYILEVADMLRRKDMSSFGKGKSRFLLGSAGKDLHRAVFALRAGPVGNHNGIWNISP